MFIKLLLLKATDSIDNHSNDKKKDDHDSKYTKLYNYLQLYCENVWY